METNSKVKMVSGREMSDGQEESLRFEREVYDYLGHGSQEVCFPAPFRSIVYNIMYS